MSAPRNLDEFSSDLEKDPAVIKALAKLDGATFAEFLESGKLEDLVKSDSVTVSSIEASGGYEDFFNIEIQSFGPVFWIWASDFDDIGYFATLKEAEDFAREEYETYIQTLEEMNEEDDWEDEGEDEGEDEDEEDEDKEEEEAK
jgi:hypothetical protein